MVNGMQAHLPRHRGLSGPWATRVGFLLMLFGFTVPAGAAATTGEAYLIVYPDYPVNTDTFYGYTTLVGHAGVLLVSESGTTKYFEFGRYDPERRGRVLQRTIPDVKMDQGTATQASLAVVMEALSKQCGKGGRIRAAKFIRMDFDIMHKYAAAQRDASDPANAAYDKDRPKYEIASNNCAHFAERVALRGNEKVDRPTILLHTPINLVSEYLEEKNAEVAWNPVTRKISVGPGDESDAKKP